ncbi:transcriptional regulatory protein-like protein [Shewanella denitrificans OS217]|uniref:Transcriptional regulatory protein-like protein n=1 Tax=Shewanella denitrificans (strain OS217 / ATCC BAA-1090 / DSM 15013) TaxID=318161 RepID=Q12IZ6_SHEDO|nr:winged helix-turn-helix domain-containing protein [Shewanella denitrificans]ABE56580.1 transcriptional regulatory protein-like protein [Shewanella denitrificans OS217]
MVHHHTSPYTGDAIYYRYQFNDLTLNTRLGTLVRDDKLEVRLPWLSYRLLSVLCEAAPGIVSQEQLLEKVWPDVVVGDETLKQRIKLLRRALNDDAHTPIYIEAIRGRGYRLLPQVIVTSEVTPTRMTSLDLANDTHVMPEDGKSYPLFWKLTSLSLAALMLIFALVALFISSGDNLAKLDENAPSSLASPGFDVELYLKGLDYYHRYREADNLHAIELFTSALAINPNLALAYSGLSDAYSQGVFQFNAPRLWQQKAIDAAYKAIALDPNLAQAYKSLGLAYYNKGWLNKAINANVKALQKQANYHEAMTNIGFIYREMGQLSKSMMWINKALTLSPNHSVSCVHKAQSLIALEDFPKAQLWLDRALSLQPDSLLANDAQGLWYLHQGRFLQAKAHYFKLSQDLPRQTHFIHGLALSQLYLGEFQLAIDTSKSLLNSDNPQIALQGRLLAALAKSALKENDNQQLEDEISMSDGNVSEVSSEHSIALELLTQEFKQRLLQGSDRAADSLSLALLYAVQNEQEASYRYLIQAINQGYLAQQLLTLHPSINTLRNDSRFTQLMDELLQQLTFQKQAYQEQK